VRSAGTLPAPRRDAQVGRPSTPYTKYILLVVTYLVVVKCRELMRSQEACEIRGGLQDQKRLARPERAVLDIFSAFVLALEAKWRDTKSAKHSVRFCIC
jgi:hypothetical protein